MSLRRQYSKWLFYGSASLTFVCVFHYVFYTQAPVTSHRVLQIAVSRADAPSMSQVLSEDGYVIMFSAVANTTATITSGSNTSGTKDRESGQVDIMVTTLSLTNTVLTCCVHDVHLTLRISTAQIHYGDASPLHTLVTSLDSRTYFALQYKCTIPWTSRDSAKLISLASRECAPSLKNYVSVYYPPSRPTALAVCARITDRNEPTPEQLISWLEIQRYLAVDKIVLYDLMTSRPRVLQQVYTHYEAMGLLEVGHYRPPNRTEGGNSARGLEQTVEYVQTESVPVLDCRQRLSGYAYVLSHDVDKLLLPRAPVTLKQLFDEEMKANPDSAGFYIDVDWSLSNPTAGETSRRRWVSDKPAWEATQLMYVPARVHTPNLSTMQPKEHYSTSKLPPNKAILRHCPGNQWDNCFPEPNMKNRYQSLHRQINSVITQFQIHK